MRLTVNSSIEPNGAVPLRIDSHGRRVALLPPPIGCLVRLEDHEVDRFREKPDRVAVFLEIDSTDPHLAGVWVRDSELEKAVAA